MTDTDEIAETRRELEARAQRLREQRDALVPGDEAREAVEEELLTPLTALHWAALEAGDDASASALESELEALSWNSAADGAVCARFAAHSNRWTAAWGANEELPLLEVALAYRRDRSIEDHDACGGWASSLSLACCLAYDDARVALGARYLDELRSMACLTNPDEETIDALVEALGYAATPLLEAGRPDAAEHLLPEMRTLIRAHGETPARLSAFALTLGELIEHDADRCRVEVFEARLRDLAALATDRNLEVASSVSVVLDDTEGFAARAGLSEEFFAVADMIDRAPLRELDVAWNESEGYPAPPPPELPEVEGWNDEVLTRGAFIEVLTREDGECKFTGFVVEASEKLLLLRQEYDWRLDQWIALPRSATKCVHLLDEAPNVRAFRDEGPHQLDPRFPVDISSLDALFLGLRRAGTPTIIAFPGDPPGEDDDTSYGTIRAATGGYVFSRRFSTAFEWRWDLDVIDYDNVLRVSFGGSYLDFYERHLEPVADYERREREVRATAEEDDS